MGELQETANKLNGLFEEANKLLERLGEIGGEATMRITRKTSTTEDIITGIRILDIQQTNIIKFDNNGNDDQGRF